MPADNSDYLHVQVEVKQLHRYEGGRVDFHPHPWKAHVYGL